VRTPPLRFVLPLGLFVALAVALSVGLTLKPGVIPSTLIDEAVPAFDLPPVTGRERGLSSAGLTGEVRLVNFFASWCIPCKAEHPLLNRLTEEGLVPVYGVNYKDEPEDVRRWLDQLGDPFARSGADLEGRIGIEWGVYGLPETFVIDAEGRIRYKHIGQMRAKDIEECILPVVEALREDGGLDTVDLPESCKPEGI
jgi:cytochrome c biogenesis protein CcmG/thiol:disulfide interchange protein DsbE